MFVNCAVFCCVNIAVSWLSVTERGGHGYCQLIVFVVDCKMIVNCSGYVGSNGICLGIWSPYQLHLAVLIISVWSYLHLTVPEDDRYWVPHGFYYRYLMVASESGILYSVHKDTDLQFNNGVYTLCRSIALFWKSKWISMLGFPLSAAVSFDIVQSFYHYKPHGC